MRYYNVERLSARCWPIYYPFKRMQGKKVCESVLFSHFETTWEKTLLRGSTISKHINRTCSL